MLHLAMPQLSADITHISSQFLWVVDLYAFMVAGFLITMGTRRSGSVAAGCS